MIINRAVQAFAYSLLIAAVQTGTASAAGSPMPGGYMEHVRYHVKVLNDSDKCVWLTPYWSTPAGSYSIMSGGPRVLAAHHSTQVDYTTPVLVNTKIQMEVKVRAEFFSTGCGGGNVADKSSESYGTPRGDDNELTVNATVVGPEEGYNIYIGSLGRKH
jgi:hypothetical protein